MCNITHYTNMGHKQHNKQAQNSNNECKMKGKKAQHPTQHRHSNNNSNDLREKNPNTMHTQLQTPQFIYYCCSECGTLDSNQMKRCMIQKSQPKHPHRHSRQANKLKRRKKTTIGDRRVVSTVNRIKIYSHNSH